MSRRWLPRGRAGVVDVSVAVLPLVIGVSQVWLGWNDGGIGGSVHGDGLARSVLVLATTLPLVWRRRAPVAVAVWVCAALAVQVLVVVPRVSFLAGLVPMLIATYSAAVYGPRRLRLLGLIAVFAAEASFYVRIPEERVGGEVLFAAFVALGTWGIGEVVRVQWHRAEDVAGRARLLVQESDAQAAAVLAEERSRIARELHDIIAHSVSVMGVQAGAARMMLDSDTEGARTALRRIEATSRSSVIELQRLLAILRDGSAATDLEPQPGVGQLPALVEQARAAGLPVSLSIVGHGQLAPGVDLAAYRIVQEALTNAIKHSGSPTSVHVGFLAGHVDLEVCDEGASKGPPNAPSYGHGLIGMRERAMLYGGTLEAGPGTDGGYIVHARLPVGVLGAS